MTLEKQVAIAVMKLATPISLFYIANQFTVGKSTAGKTIQEVCMVIQNVLANHFICLINLKKVVTNFHCMGFLNCMWVMDSTHTPILCPPKGIQAFIPLMQASKPWCVGGWWSGSGQEKGRLVKGENNLEVAVRTGKEKET